MSNYALRSAGRPRPSKLLFCEEFEIEENYKSSVFAL